MLLRHKLGLISLAYAVSLLLMLSMSAWCIGVYFRSAFSEYESIESVREDVAALRRRVRSHRAALQRGEAADIAQAYSQFRREFLDISDRVDKWLGAGEFTSEWSDVEWLAAGNTAQPDEKALEEFDRRLVALSHMLNSDRQKRVQNVADTQSRVLLILTACAIAGAGLCVGGVLFIRRWVISPVAELRTATREIASGNYDHRIQTRSRDELGRLGDEVNQMCSTIIEMQERLVEQKNLETAGELVGVLAHNIRNPLAGVRALAEETANRHADDSVTAECQQRIVAAVDRLESWFRDLQHAVTPVSLNLQIVRVDELVRNVVDVLGPMLDQRGVRVDVAVGPEIQHVNCDALHLEQALVALLTNAIQASSPGKVVRVVVAAHPSRSADWTLVVEDEGEGIPDEVISKILLPHFTTKHDGSGLGLAMVNKVIKSHGGRLNIKSHLGRGTRFEAVLPGRVTES